MQELAENLEIVTAERQVQSDKLKQLKEDRQRSIELTLHLRTNWLPQSVGIGEGFDFVILQDADTMTRRLNAASQLIEGAASSFISPKASICLCTF